MRTLARHSVKRTGGILKALTMMAAIVLCLSLLSEPAYGTESVGLRNAADEKQVTSVKDAEAEHCSPYNAFIDDYESFEVTSSSLHDGVWDNIISNTDKGSNKSPQLEWTAVDGAGLYVIIMDDPTAMAGCIGSPIM